jgi:hypothetical protein
MPKITNMKTMQAFEVMSWKFKEVAANIVEIYPSLICEVINTQFMPAFVVQRLQVQSSSDKTMSSV